MEDLNWGFDEDLVTVRREILPETLCTPCSKIKVTFIKMGLSDKQMIFWWCHTRGFMILWPPQLHWFALNIEHPAQNNIDIKCQIVVDMVSCRMTVTEMSKVLGLSQKAIYGIKKQFKERGMIERKKGQGQKRSMQTKVIVNADKGRIKRNLVCTIRGMAKAMSLTLSTVDRIVHEDLGMKSRARRKKHLINNTTKAKRLTRSKVLLQHLKAGTLPILFSDKKLFCIDWVSNSRTDWYITDKKPEDVPDNIKFTFKTKHTASVMVLAVMASNGKKCPAIFIRNNEKINAAVYINLLGKHVKPWIKRSSEVTCTCSCRTQSDKKPCLVEDTF